MGKLAPEPQDDLTQMSIEKLIEQLAIEEQNLKQAKISRNFIQQERVNLKVNCVYRK